MDPAILQSASVTWASISAIALLLLGIVVLAGGRARSPGSVAFGAFVILWGAHVAAGRWMAYVTEPLAPRAHLTYFALLLPLPYLLVQFARAFAKEGARSRWWRAATVASVATPLLAVLTLLAAPELIYEGPTLFGTVFPDWGPLFAPLAIFPFFGALALALAALESARAASTTARTSLRHALLAAGIATFVAFSAGNNFAFYAADALSRQVHPLAGAYLALFSLLSLVVLFLGVRAALEAARAPTPRARRLGLLVALALLVPLGWGLLEGILAYFVLPRFNTVGLWRLAGVGLITYGLARWRMPELAQRSRHAAATALGVAASATSGGFAVGLFLLVAPNAPLLMLAGLAVPLATITPSVRLARRVLHVEAARDLSNATLAPRIETYRAALEASLARNSLEDDASFLAALRDQLAITPDAHDALVCVARGSVLPPPDASHPGYERLRLLGEGAHGRAWLARRRADDALAVIKEPAEQSEATRLALVRQAKLSRQARHPRLVAIHEVVDSARGSFLVMDYAPGGSLAERLADGPLPPAQAAALAIDVLDGLEALHRAGATHGDVKPANVLFDAEGRALLADFGLARSHDAEATRTFIGSQGTLAAMAPEQLRGAPPTPASDIYAAGALVYRALTGEHYLKLAGLDETRARAMVLDAPPRLPHPRVPALLEPILARALAKDPQARHPSARIMREDVERAASHL